MLLLLVVVLVAFSSCLPLGYLFDDFLIMENARSAPLNFRGLSLAFHLGIGQVHDGWQPAALAGWQVTFFRPLMIAGLMLDHTLGGSAWIGHLHNLLLHSLIMVVYYFLILELFPGRRFVAFVSALFIGLHPHNLMTVAWISGRTELIPALWMLLGLIALLRFRRGRGLGTYLLVLSCMAMALLGKENGMIFPLLLLAADLLVEREYRLPWWYHLPFFALAALYFALRTHFLGSFETPPQSFYYHPPSSPGFLSFVLEKVVLTLGSVFFLGTSFYPVHAWMHSHPLALVTYAVPVVSGTLWLFWKVRSRLAVFLGIWIGLALAPSIPLVSSPHYFYFALPAVIPLFVLLRDRWAEALVRRSQRPPLRRAVWAISGLFALNAFFSCWAIRPLFRQAQQPAIEVRTEMPDPPPGARFYFIDLPLPGVYITPDLRMRYRRNDIRGHVLSLAPVPDERADSRIEWVDSRTLRVTARGPAYFTDRYTRDITFAKGPQPEGARVETEEYAIIAERAEVQSDGSAGIRTLRYEFRTPPDPGSQFFFVFRREGVSRLAVPAGGRP